MLQISDSRSIFLELPWPVSTNSYHGNNRRGNKYVTRTGKKFKSEVRKEFLAQMGAGFKPLEGSLLLEVYLAAPTKAKRDIDNHAGKSLLDALTDAGAWLDDSQVDLQYTERCRVEKGGRCFVRITQVSQKLRPCPSAESVPGEPLSA